MSASVFNQNSEIKIKFCLGRAKYINITAIIVPMTSGNREDYLIEILRLTNGEGKVKNQELAERLNVSPASVSEMIKVLSNEGYVKYTKYVGAELTEKGLEYARQLRKKHEIGRASCRERV